MSTPATLIPVHRVADGDYDHNGVGWSTLNYGLGCSIRVAYLGRTKYVER